jgi:F-type H+-transporting ATPase subunit delta
MSESVVARPYAQAVFEQAKETHRVSAWEAVLAFLALVVANSQASAWLRNPRITPPEKVSFLQDFMPLGLEETRFLETVVHFDRLKALPDIYQQFLQLKQADEMTIEVILISAEAVEIPLQHQFQMALERRLNKKVTLRCEIQPTLLGGAILHMGDQVIDGSIRGRLHQLAEGIVSL